MTDVLVVLVAPNCRVVMSAIGLYREIAIEIAISRKSLATLMGVMCSTSQCELRSTFPNASFFSGCTRG